MWVVSNDYVVVFWWVLMGASISLFLFSSYMVDKSIYEKGIVLTSDFFQYGNKKYPISIVKYSEVVDFIGTGGMPGVFNPYLNRWLAIFLMKNGRIRYILIRGTDTENVLELSNNIRKLKGISEQEKDKIKEYGGMLGFYKWKKEVMNKIHKK